MVRWSPRGKDLEFVEKYSRENPLESIAKYCRRKGLWNLQHVNPIPVWTKIRHGKPSPGIYSKESPCSDIFFTEIKF